MTGKRIYGAVALSVAIGLLVTSFPKAAYADGPASVQLLAFLVPIKRPKGADASYPKEAPVTITLEIYDASDVGAICELAPRIRDAVMETLGYYDGLNFANKVSCPLIMNIGLRDNVCPPEVGRAVFDAAGAADKTLYPYVDQGHDAGLHLHSPVIAEFFARHLQNAESA